MILHHWTGKELADATAVSVPLDSRREFLRKLGVGGGLLLASGLWVPRANAASTIKARTISSVVDNRIALSNSNFARAVSGISGWSTLRVGIRYCFNNNAANITSTPRFAIGFCSGQSNIYLDATTTHWAGVLTDSATLTYNAAAGAAMTYFGTAAIRPAKRITSTLTTGTGLGDAVFAADTTATTRRMFFADLLHGSPNYTFKAFYCNATTAAPDVLSGDFLTQMGLVSPAFTNHTYASLSTLAIDEGTNGTFDNINIAWDRSSPTLEICDVAVAKVA